MSLSVLYYGLMIFSILRMEKRRRCKQIFDILTVLLLLLELTVCVYSLAFWCYFVCNNNHILALAYITVVVLLLLEPFEYTRTLNQVIKILSWVCLRRKIERKKMRLELFVCNVNRKKNLKAHTDACQTDIMCALVLCWTKAMQRKEQKW